MIACILLSAGSSERFGSPKALAKLHEVTVIEHLQKLLLSTQVGEVIVVLGAQADQIKPHLLNHKSIKSVYNKDHNLGQTSSFKAGLLNVSKHVLGVMLLPVDYPFISVDSINLLNQCFLEQHPAVLIPTFKGKKGHPPLFSIDLRDEFLALGNEQGLNTIAHAHQADTTILPVNDDGIIRTFNTKEEFESMKLSTNDFR